MKILNELRDTGRNPYKYGTECKRAANKKMVGYFCSYTPEELIFAAEAHPFRIFGSTEKLQLSDSHLQSYCCSPVRRALEDCLSGHLDFLDGVVFPHTCDSMQRLSDIWRLNLSFAFHMDVVLPVKLNTESAKEYFIDVIRTFKEDLETVLQTSISHENLKHSITIYNQIRSAVQRIYELKRSNPDIIKGSDLYHIVRSSMIADRNLLPETLNAIVTELESKNHVKSIDRKRLILTGSVCNHPDIYQLIEEAGGVAVWDDFCTGSRYFDGMINVDGDPIIAIAERYLNRIICPAKHFNLTGRAESLLEMVKKSNADGVIFLFLKFCDPHGFDYPTLKETLDKEGIPNMLFEVEDQHPSGGQLKTRIEAFLEMI